MPHTSGARLLLLLDPCLGANLGAVEEGAIAPLHFHRFGAGQEELAGKVGTETAVLQSPLDDAALKHAALVTHRQAQLVGASPTGSCLLCLKSHTRATVKAANCRQTSLAVVHG